MIEPINPANPVRKWLLPVALIILCCVPFLRSYEMRDRALKEDEVYWIGQAYYFHLAIEERDWSNPDWQLLPARENPVLGKYVIGQGLRVNGLSVTNVDWLGVFFIVAKDRPNAWGDAKDRQERQAVLDRMDPATRELALGPGQFKQPPEYATTARLIMLVFGIVSILAVFALARLYTNAVVAFLAALIFSLHPAVVAAYTEVGVDILATAFSLLAMICFVLIERNLWRQSGHPRPWRALICVGGGLSLAFAVGSKLNAAAVGFVGAILTLWFAASYLGRRNRDAGESCIVMIGLLAISLAVFVGSSPANYPNPAKGIWALYADNQRGLEIQKSIPALQHPLRSWGEHQAAVANLTAFHPAIFGLIVVAFLFYMVQARKAGKAFPLIPVWWLVAIVCVTAWIPFARPRYVLPVVAPSVILVCCAGGQIYQTVRSRVATRGTTS
ncbi:MAG TPA: phospholipid carrier-dependent glycosyltransferase [Verrucomicrobiae bacterium]|nr:phospholipid carrier-dependent glycosyltransferase [Verrucomicrobiae bacterium]